MVSGIAEKTGFSAAPTSYTSPDYNPAEDYPDLQAGYVCAFWLAISLVLTALCATFAAMDLKVGNLPKSDPGLDFDTPFLDTQNE